MEKKIIAGLVAIAVILAVVIFAGCIETSPYSVEYSPGIYFDTPALIVNVSGPADDLAIILANPQGYTDIQYIRKEALIDNFESVGVRMCERGNPPAGTYKLAVKTITPEKVVYKTEKNFKPAIVGITKAKVKLTPVGRYTILGYCWGDIEEYSVIVENKGELPIEINEVAITLDGTEFSDTHPQWVLPGETKIRRGGYLLHGILDHQPTAAKIDLYSGEEKVASAEARIIIK